MREIPNPSAKIEGITILRTGTTKIACPECGSNRIGVYYHTITFSDWAYFDAKACDPKRRFYVCDRCQCEFALSPPDLQ